MVQVLLQNIRHARKRRVAARPFPAAQAMRRRGPQPDARMHSLVLQPYAEHGQARVAAK